MTCVDQFPLRLDMQMSGKDRALPNDMTLRWKEKEKESLVKLTRAVRLITTITAVFYTVTLIVGW